MFIAALVFAAAGCKKKSGAGTDCEKAIDRSMELSRADMAKMPGVDDKVMQKMKELGLQHCKDDTWPSDVLQCMADAKTEAESQACYGKLTKEQQDKMNQAAMDMTTGTGSAGSAGAATGSAGAAMGSAGAAMGNAGAVGSDTGAGSAAAPE